MHMSNLLRAACLFGSLSCTAAVSESEGSGVSPGIEVATFAEKFNAPSNQGPGAPQLIPAEQLRVGDEIFYTMRVRNGGDTPIANPSIVKAIPRNTRYIQDSAVGPAAEITYSIDGGTTFAPAGELTIATATGERRAEASDFTHIRWQLRHALAPRATALLRFRGVFQ